MSKAVEHYLDRVMAYANLKHERAAPARAEMRDHLLQKIADLEKAGESREDAVFQAIQTHGNPMRVGYCLRGGFPWLDVRMKGTARGVVAVGPKAVGVVAFGGTAIGVFSFGGLSIGLVSFGGIAVAAALAWGMLAFAPVALGGVVVGFIAMGVIVFGVITMGWLGWLGKQFWVPLSPSLRHLGQEIMRLGGGGGRTNEEIVLTWLAVYMALVGVFVILAATHVWLRSREKGRLMREDPEFSD